MKNPFTDIYAKCGTLAPFPLYIDVELTNHCNFRCKMCPTGAGTARREKGYMSEEVYRILVEAGVPLRFVRWGEPALHPKFLEFLKIAKNNGLLTHVNTNGSLLTNEQVSYIDSLKFSFQGTDRDGYREMRRVDFFSMLTWRIDEICTLPKRPFVHVATTVTDETKKQVKDFRKLFSFADLVTVGKTVPEYTDLDFPAPTKRFADCREMGSVLAVNWDGTVSACCNDYDNLMIVGDVRASPIKEIWTAEKMYQYREHGGSLCSFCYDYMGEE